MSSDRSSAGSTPHRGLTADLSPEQQAHLQAWRADALDLMPYFARLLFSLRAINAPGLGTFAVDGGHRLYVDFETVIGWGPRLCAEALLHECGHLFGAHRDLAEDIGVRDDQLKQWNLGADMAINDDLRDAGCAALAGMAVFAADIGEPDFQTPIYYFDAIVRLQQAQQGAPGGAPSGQSGTQPGGQSGQQPGEAANGDPGQTSGGTEGADGSPFSGCGSGSGGETAPCELPDDDDLGGAAPAASVVEQKVVRVSTAASIREHAKSRGTVPGGLVDTAEAILAPSKTPWQQVLSSHVRRAVTHRAGLSDVSYSRRSRRRHRATVLTASGPRRYVVPGLVTPVPRIEVVRDTSGSMSPTDLAAVGREIEAIARRVGVRGDDLTVTDVDAVAHERVPYRSAASIRAVHGRGGTDMRVGIAAASERVRDRASAIVVITDGYTPWPLTKGPVPVVAAIVPGDSGVVPDSMVAGIPDWIRCVVVEPAAG